MMDHRKRATLERELVFSGGQHGSLGRHGGWRGLLGKNGMNWPVIRLVVPIIGLE